MSEKLQLNQIGSKVCNQSCEGVGWGFSLPADTKVGHVHGPTGYPGESHIGVSGMSLA